MRLTASPKMENRLIPNRLRFCCCQLQNAVRACFSHCARHTYGTMLITAGVDLYTASKMMGHADVRPTQIYAKIIDKKKEEAVSLIDKIF